LGTDLGGEKTTDCEMEKNAGGLSQKTRVQLKGRGVWVKGLSKNR